MVWSSHQRNLFYNIPTKWSSTLCLVSWRSRIFFLGRKFQLWTLFKKKKKSPNMSPSGFYHCSNLPTSISWTHLLSLLHKNLTALVITKFLCPPSLSYQLTLVSPWLPHLVLHRLKQCSEVDGTLQGKRRPTVNLLLLILSSYYNALGSCLLLLTHVPR